MRIGSAGKTFSVTGWKVGYITAAPAVLKPIAKAHQFVTFTTPPNLQWGTAVGLRKEDAYFAELATDMQAKRDRLVHRSGRDRLRGAAVARHLFRHHGFPAARASTAPTRTSADTSRWRRVSPPCRSAPSTTQRRRAPRIFARFCFCKHDSTLDAALERLEKHFKR